MKKAYFVHGLRTPFTRAFKGAYIDVRPDDLLSILFKEQVHRHAILKEFLEEVMVGCAYPEGEQGYNIARMAALGAGLNLPGLTMNRLCASSLEAVCVAASRIQTGMAQCILVGGVESMSRITRRGAGFSESELILESCPEAYVQMGETAENVHDRYDISRSKQEEFAKRSHELSAKAYEDGFYSHQIYEHLVSRDEGIRVPVNMEKMKSLKPAFRESGSVTAATSSPLSDGATSGFLVNEEIFNKLNCDGLLIEGYASGAVDPAVMGLGPVPATQRLFKITGKTVNDLKAIEMNEAFAIQVLSCAKDLEIPMELINTKGGAIALGHPLGASGLRLLMTLHHRLRELGGQSETGLASLCVGGGQGLSVLASYQNSN